MNEFQKRLVGWVVVFVVVALLTVGVLGARSCVVNERDQTAACSAVGGKVLYRDCVKIEYLPTENWRK